MKHKLLCSPKGLFNMIKCLSDRESSHVRGFNFAFFPQKDNNLRSVNSSRFAVNVLCGFTL